MLAIDIGNSRIKWVLFQGDKVISQSAIDYTPSTFEMQLDHANLPLLDTDVAISHVSGTDLKKRLLQWLAEKKCKRFFFAKTYSEQCGLQNSYSEAENMGVDRWLAMIAAYNIQYRKKNQAVCVIDCGTAITLDIVHANGRHLGGLIMPGFTTMRDSLFVNAANIQKVALSQNEAVSGLTLANATEDAISAGCSQLIVNGLSGMLNRYDGVVGEDILCLLTGGDGLWVSGLLECENTYESLLVEQGLKRVAEEKLIMEINK